jgi:hypothetical protein
MTSGVTVLSFELWAKEGHDLTYLSNADLAVVLKINYVRLGLK